ncbi:MAG: formate--tetrahydrofolate ligase [Candidatus Sericytochromatia bacterium]|nr:formate--tetrahydrofolate ligase [Candidatus Sericytochromatia bacterium]
MPLVPSIPSDLDIAKASSLRPVAAIAEKLGLTADEWEPYGHHKAKIDLDVLAKKSSRSTGKLILVSAISPTPAGEGKTTVTIGLGQALSRLGEKAIIAIREPSLGPVFGVKGGATGGGYSQVLPMEDINLHFTGDFHAITAANNLLSALIDNHLHQGNSLQLDPRRVTFSRVLDVNDRALRHVVMGLGGSNGGIAREETFMITPASEVMAILCLATDLNDLQKRLGDIIIGYDVAGHVIEARALNAEGAMTALLRDAMKPNLVQTGEHTPALVHGGPFANIAHGCNTVVATRTALKLGDWVVTEAGFGADLGAEKFFDIKCRAADLRADAVVLVATIRSLKMHGGVPKPQLKQPNLAALQAGACNLERHIHNVKNVYGMPCVVALNRFETDDHEEIEWLRDYTGQLGAELVVTEVHARGGEGGINLAHAVRRAANAPNQFSFVYDLKQSPEEKIRAIAQKVYGAHDIHLSAMAQKKLFGIRNTRYADYPICIAKTPYSFSDDATRLGAPSDWTLNIRDIRVAGGARFIVALAGDIMTMPGLPAIPAAERITVGTEGEIAGLF